MPYPAASAVPGAEPQPFAAWAQVLALVSQRDIVLSSFMNNSAAYRQGNRILIDAGTLFNDFIRTNEKSHAVLKAMLTETNAQWNSVALHSAIAEEHEIMKNRRK